MGILEGVDDVYTLVADSGGTTTEWGLVEDPDHRLETVGLNPHHLRPQQIVSVLRSRVRPWLGDRTLKSVRFFGAGLGTSELCTQMGHMLEKHLETRIDVNVASDLMGAALACLGTRPGLVGILGTGSVALASDGTSLVARRGGHGYLLGDEGGAASLGRSLLRALLQGKLPQAVLRDYEAWSGMAADAWVTHVYSCERAGSFLAAQARFLSRHLEVAGVRKLLLDDFDHFLREYLLPLCEVHPGPVVLMGGVARAHNGLLLEHCAQIKLEVEVLMEKPIDRMLTGLSLSAGLGRSTRSNSSHP